MPASSKDQQRAAAIALNAKKEGTVDELPKGSASAGMASSMSEKELDKYASTKHKGLPENKPNNEMRQWAGSSLVEVFKEEMLDTDGEGEAIASDKPVNDQVEDGDLEKDSSDRSDSEHDWVSPTSNPTHGGSGQASNTTGARVSEGVAKPKLKDNEKLCDACNGSGIRGGHGDRATPMQIPANCDVCHGKGKVVKESYDPNSLDLLFEGPSNSEYYMADEYYDLTHSPEYEHDYDDQAMIAQSEVDYEAVHRLQRQIIDEVKRNLDYAARPDSTTTPSLEHAIELADDITFEFGEFSWQSDIIYDEYGDQVPKDQNHRFDYAAKEVAAKELGKEAWEEWSEENGESEDLDEGAGSHNPALGETNDEKIKRYLGMADAAYGVGDKLAGDSYTQAAKALMNKTNEGKETDDLALLLEQLDGLDMDADDYYELDRSEWDPHLKPSPRESMINDMADHIVTHKLQHGRTVDSWDPMTLLQDFDYEYQVSLRDPDDIAAAQEAIEKAKLESGRDDDMNELYSESVQQSTERWQKLANIPLQEGAMDPQRQKWAEKYIKKMVGYEWSWDDISDKLQSQHGVRAYDVDETLKPYWDSLTRVN